MLLLLMMMLLLPATAWWWWRWRGWRPPRRVGRLSPRLPSPPALPPLLPWRRLQPAAGSRQSHSCCGAARPAGRAWEPQPHFGVGAACYGHSDARRRMARAVRRTGRTAKQGAGSSEPATGFAAMRAPTPGHAAMPAHGQAQCFPAAANPASLRILWAELPSSPYSARDCRVKHVGQGSQCRAWGLCVNGHNHSHGPCKLNEGAPRRWLQPGHTSA